MFIIGKICSLFLFRKLNPPKPKIKSQIREIVYNDDNRYVKNNIIKNFPLFGDEEVNATKLNHFDNWSFFNNNDQN